MLLLHHHLSAIPDAGSLWDSIDGIGARRGQNLQGGRLDRWALRAVRRGPWIPDADSMGPSDFPHSDGQLRSRTSATRL
jgi:hypothetical protein